VVNISTSHIAHELAASFDLEEEEEEEGKSLRNVIFTISSLPDIQKTKLRVSYLLVLSYG
jgi:hypothetical protein